jgi:hypothetical protein
MKEMPHLSFSQLVRLFGIWFFAQSVVLAGASYFFSTSVVLGTNTISPFSAMLYSMIVQTLIAIGAVPLLELLQDFQQKSLGTTSWMLFYFGVNTIGLWIISRFAEQLGLGLGSWIVAAVLGLTFSFVQGFFAIRMGKDD